jgi:hypothetical protein
MRFPDIGVFDIYRLGMYVLINRGLGELNPGDLLDALSGAYENGSTHIINKVMTVVGYKIRIEDRFQLACQYNDTDRAEHYIKMRVKPEFGLLGACRGNNYILAEKMSNMLVTHAVEVDSVILGECMRIAINKRASDIVRVICRNAYKLEWHPDWHKYIAMSIMDNAIGVFNELIYICDYGWNDHFRFACMLGRTEIILVILNKLGGNLDLRRHKQFAIDNGYDDIAGEIDKRMKALRLI